MDSEERATCKACANEADPATFCEQCGDGPFCSFCRALRHGVPCGKKNLMRRIREFLGLQRRHDPTYVRAESLRQIKR